VAMPDFFIIGAPKAGTTALHAALAKQPGLYLSPVKEPKYFMCDNQPPRRWRSGPGDAHSYLEWIWQRDRYEALFDAAPLGWLRGESTPCYLYDKQAHVRIRRAVPHAKLIAVLPRSGFIDDIALLERVTGRSYRDWLGDTGKQAFTNADQAGNATTQHLVWRQRIILQARPARVRRRLARTAS
jgi:hypothetical protein